MSTADRFRRRLAAARRRLTGAAALRGLALAVGVVGAVFVLAVALEAALWMGVTARTLVAWTLGGLAAGLFGWGVGVPLLRGIGWLPGLDERAVAARADADFAGVGDRLAAVLDLADGHASSAPAPLRDAALGALAAEIEGVPFERVRAFGPARDAAAWAAVPLAVLALAVLVAPTTAGGAAHRLLAPGTHFAPPAAFALLVAPGDTAVARGTPLPLRVTARARQSDAVLPLAATLEIGRVGERAVERVRLARGDTPEGDGAANGAWTHTVPAVQADLRYRVEADGVTSAWFRARVENRPVVRGLRVTVAPPAYARRPARALPEGVGDVTGLAGSAVRVRVVVAGTPAVRGWLRVAFDGRPAVRVPLSLAGDVATAAFRLVGPGRYSVHLVTAAGQPNADPAEYALGTTSDAPPQIVMVQGADGELTDGPRRMTFRVSDDIGLAGAQMVWRIARRVGGGGAGAWRAAALPLRRGASDQQPSIVWRLPGARPGDVVELYGQVRDSGPAGQTARTPVVTLRVTSVAQQLDAFEAARDSTRRTLDALGTAQQQAAQRSEQLRESLRRDPRPDWEDRRQVEQLQRDEAAMQEQARALREQMRRLAEEARNEGTLDDQTQRLMDQMETVLQELESPQLRDALQRLQEAMEQLDMRQMMDASQQAERAEQTFQQRLERAMELMRRMEAAVQMQDVARRAEDLAERQERAAQESERLTRDGDQREGTDQDGEEQDGEQDDETRDDAGSDEREEGLAPEARTPEAERARQAEQQRRAAEDAAALQRQIEQLRQQLEQLRGAPTEPADDASQQMQQGGGLPQQMQDAAQQIERGESSEAQEQQRDAARRFRRMAQQMQSAAQQMQRQRQRVDAEALRRALEDVLTLSQRQEALAAETGRTPSGNPALVGLGRRQRDLSDGFRAVRDTLVRVGRSVPQLGAAVQTRASNADTELSRALAALAQRQAPLAAAHQRGAMSSLNDLALLLAGVLDQLQNEAQSSGGGGGEGSPQQQMQQMGESQQRLNRQIQQLLNQAAGQRLSGDGARRMRQIAEQQEALRRQLDGMLNGGGAAGMDPATRSALQRLAEQMREAAQDLRSGRADLRALPRQQQIHERMLQAERSMNQRGREERREGEGARRQPPPPPASPPVAPPPPDRVRPDLLRAPASGYSADYLDLIRAYFERLRLRYGE